MALCMTCGVQMYEGLRCNSCQREYTITRAEQKVIAAAEEHEQHCLKHLMQYDCAICAAVRELKAARGGV